MSVVKIYLKRVVRSLAANSYIGGYWGNFMLNSLSTIRSFISCSIEVILSVTLDNFWLIEVFSLIIRFSEAARISSNLLGCLDRFNTDLITRLFSFSSLIMLRNKYAHFWQV
jgi:hypothetical protein